MSIIFPPILNIYKRYVSGETIYIPAKNEKKAWGESSGYRAYLAKRNQSMKKDFADGLKLFERYYIGPMKMPLNLFERNTGPEEGMKYKIDKDWWPIHVAAFEDSIKKDPDMPPLIAHYVEHGFEMNDGNTRLQAYKNLGVKEAHFIIWITEQEEYEEFMTRYGNFAEGAPVIRR
ncbi:ParB/Srx family N-terminal domain-containing protein [Treponema sp.]|uniref:ParB/Srx family N-terminal domain-containing protein n=1 Tax=Treponema sp. TaxID=166 RepID=UPI00298E9706|nr:ParB/Srx family N-terminal domain-containing protein [Treponema sp.]MCR5613763.1 ParB/Srx family N-terminal domain-containing protein [Treponema sp.]